MCEDFLGYFESINFQVKLPRATFWETFEELGLFFIPAYGHTEPPPVLLHIISVGRDDFKNFKVPSKMPNAGRERWTEEGAEMKTPKMLFMIEPKWGRGCRGSGRFSARRGGGVLTIVTRYGYTLKGD